MPNPYLLATALTLLGLSTVQAQDMTGWPDWLVEAMAKESKRLKSQTVDTDDKQYRFQVAGKINASSPFDGGWYVETDIKSEAPLECYVFTDQMDLATLLNNLAEASIEAQAESNNGPVGNKSVSILDAGAIDDAPYLAIEWIYTVGEPPNALVGYTKVRAALNRDIAQACTHNYVGYRQTFADAFEDFVRTTELPDAETTPYYEEIALQTLGEQNIGIAQLRFTHDADGDTEINLVTSSLVPVGPGAVTTEDSTTLSWSTPEGALISAHTATSQNGELVDNLQISRNDDGDWQVNGLFQGKEIAETIAGDVQPLTDLGAMRTTRALFAGKESESAFPLWVSDADPTQFLEGRVIRDDAEVAGRGRMQLGPLSMTAQFDDNGSATSATLNVGSAVISLTRLWARGAIP
jgi:hypothetical protein